MSNSKSKNLIWKNLTEDLKAEIQNGIFKLGEKFYSVNEICDKANVSSITARRVLSELEKEKLIEVIHGKGSFITKSPKALDIKVLIHELHTREGTGPQNYLIIFQLLEGISKAAAETGANISIITHGDFLKNKKSGNNLIVFENLNIEIAYKTDIRKGNNIVVIHSCEEYDGCGSVRIDYEKGAFTAVKHLLELGHQRIAFLGGMISNDYMLPRFEGYLKALKSNKIDLDLKLVKETKAEWKEDEWTMEVLLKMKNPPTAIFAANDSRALHILKYCEENKIRVPEEISIIGFDNIPETSFSTPQLTTMDTRLRQLGKEAVYLLHDLEGGKETKMNRLIIPELKLRKSAANCKRN